MDDPRKYSPDSYPQHLPSGDVHHHQQALTPVRNQLSRPMLSRVYPSRPIPPVLFPRGPDGHPILPPGTYRTVTAPPAYPGGPSQAVHFISTGPPKTRNRIRPYQLKRLEELFASDTHPATTERDQLGREIGLELKTVTIWFQNKRQTLKKELNQGQGSDHLKRRRGSDDAIGSSEEDQDYSPERRRTTPSHDRPQVPYTQAVSSSSSWEDMARYGDFPPYKVHRRSPEWTSPLGTQQQERQQQDVYSHQPLVPLTPGPKHPAHHFMLATNPHQRPPQFVPRHPIPVPLVTARGLPHYSAFPRRLAPLPPRHQPAMPQPLQARPSLEWACERAAAAHMTEPEDDDDYDDIQVVNGPSASVSPSKSFDEAHIARSLVNMKRGSFEEQNQDALESVGSDADIGGVTSGAESSDEIEAITPATSLRTLPKIANNSPEIAGINIQSEAPNTKYSEEMLDAALVLCDLHSI